MSAGIKANNDGSAAIQVGGTDYIEISATGNVTIPQNQTISGTLTVTGAATLPTIKSSTSATPPTIQDSAGTQIGTFCRAWVNFNGTTALPTIRGSFNVTSITDNGGSGNYNVNFTNHMPDANYSATASHSIDFVIRVDGLATSTYRIVCNAANTDAGIISSAVFR